MLIIFLMSSEDPYFKTVSMQALALQLAAGLGGEEGGLAPGGGQVH